MTLEPSTGTAAFTPSCGAASEASLLRFMTCGSVDDGKSTLIGRLLLDGNLLHEDQLVALRVDSVTTGTRGGALDCALLLDGLAAEREQGITIDVAYRYFATPQRKFIVADAPGHEQFTRNMVTGASTADLAIVLIDARKGVLPQTRRHSYLASLLGIRQVVLAVNKMDLVAYAQDTFEAIRAEYLAFATRLGIAHVTAIPVCAVDGDNVVASPSRNMPWYTGPALMQHLEAVEVDQARAHRAPFRMPVQSVHRPDSGFRGFAGCLASGGIAPGAIVRVAHSGKQSRIDRIVSSTGDLDSAVASQSVMLTLTDELDIARGDMLCSDLEPAAIARQFEATLVWMGEQPMLRGRTYLLKAGTKTVVATVTPLKYKINVESLEHVAATTLALNEIGVVGLELDRPIAFDPYVENRDTGSFILIDRMSHDTVAAGLVHFALRRDENIHWQALGVSRAARQAMNQHGSGVVWFTGLSGAGKSALANELERALHAMGHRTYLLDGDNLRHGLNKDLGFTAADRVENIRRVAEVAKLMADAGLIVLTAFISPFSAERQMARELIGNDAFVEVFVDAPLAVAEARDTKGLYRKARRGELVNFTGIDSPYEAPKTPDLRIDTTCVSVSSAAALIMQRLQAMGIAIKS